MTAKITGIVGRPTTPKGFRMWMTANETQWMRAYYAHRQSFERKRRLENRPTDAEWFITMSDESEIRLPSIDEVRDLEQELETITMEFWAKALRLPD